MTNDITLFVEPVADVQSALASYQRMKDFVAGVLKEHTDFGVVPGTTKPTLLKPGAEKLSRFFGLYRIKSTKTRYFVVMNNVLDSSRDIHEVRAL
jgi:hypothetical protein